MFLSGGSLSLATGSRATGSRATVSLADVSLADESLADESRANGSNRERRRRVDRDGESESRDWAISLETLTGEGQGRLRFFPVQNVTIGRGKEPDYPVHPEERTVGRGIHCRIMAAESSDGDASWCLRNEHRNPIRLSTEGRLITLTESDEILFRTPATIQFPGSQTCIELRSPEDPPSSMTRTLLERSQAGDERAREELLERNLDWIRQRVHRRLGPGLRARVETLDLVQEAAIRFLRVGPKFVTDDERSFRALMARIIENAICDENDRQQAKIRDYRRESPLDADRVGALGRGPRTTDRPSQVAIVAEERELLELAIACLKRDHQEIIRLRDFEELSYPEIAKRLGIKDDTARRRHDRAVDELRWMRERLEKGALEEDAGDDPDRAE